MNVVLGTGPLGQAVMQELLKRGEPVTMVNSSGKGPLAEGVQVLQADLLNEVQARQMLKGAEVIYHCASPAYHKWDQLFGRMQENIVNGAAESGAKLIVAENLYMYGPVGSVMKENLPFAAMTKKGRVRGELSEQLLKAHREGKVQVVIGRGSDFFGPGVLNSAVGERFFKPIMKGKPSSVFGDPDTTHTYTYIGDFGSALVTLGSCEEAFGEVWHVPNAPAVTTRQFAKLVGASLGTEGSIQPMGRTMLRIGGLFIPAARESIEMLYQFENDFIVDSSKFSLKFGINATPMEESIARTLDWYRSRT
ncbi:NAD-dependent epimerase/dehydratase family protein [Paenibacillus sp. YPG26]|uniref:NAD-dependent epimerase/dehydratase family protein n=1 Tax=Paenibacillus sp. YPG26 TaxID=2878915 RepID=UPI00203D5580|nr:NAD-dependent epimerase/dehydratase family protein [Paenibacillus sp. YPG26]USB31863.1 NAD-dependent epimerase/dehydratase family protein [Paenibacillus sp. YPG26]